MESGLSTKQPPSTKPADDSQGKQADQAKMFEARRKIKYWKDLEEARRRIREEAKQRKFQETQVATGEKQVKDLEVVKEKEDSALKMAQRKTEIRGGVGG